MTLLLSYAGCLAIGFIFGLAFMTRSKKEVVINASEIKSVGGKPLIQTSGGVDITIEGNVN